MTQYKLENLSSRFKAAGNDLYEFMQRRLDRHLGAEDQAKRFVAQCRSNQATPDMFDVLVHSGEFPDWLFERTLSKESLERLDNEWSEFKSDCSSSLDSWVEQEGSAPTR